MREEKMKEQNKEQYIIKVSNKINSDSTIKENK